MPETETPETVKLHPTFEQERQYELGTYTKYPVALARGAGCRVTDVDEREYLDFYAGHAVALVGHCHPRVVAALQGQAASLMFYSNLCYQPPRGHVAERLVTGAPEGIGKVFFCNSGSEANEAALKMARRYTGKTEIISFTNAFHGRTMAALGATALPGYHLFEPSLPGYRYATFGDLASVEALIGPDTAGVIVEKIQSIGGIQVAEPAFYQGLRALCDAHGLVLIADEVQTGLGRCGGALWFSQQVGMRPDLMTAAKALGGGFPIGATFVSSQIAETIRPNEHGTTFGGGPLAMACVEAVLDVIADEGLIARAALLGQRLSAGLADIPGVTAVRGAGLLLGVDLAEPAGPVVARGWQAGVLVGTSKPTHTVRVIPPLIISESDVDEFLARFAGLLA
jgi:acetylornithine/succinyldiaminopimelate/putrescine aminotransferase